MSNLQVILTKKPGPTYPEVNDVFECKAVDLPEQNQLKEDEILVQTLYLSIDAAMRVWITG
jgi:NADPH-dependent curcumin reductase CurA